MKRWMVVLGVVLGSMAPFWIFRSKPTAADQLPVPTVTFNNEIVGMLDRHCVMCHSENGLSFPLETYEQTFLKGQEIRASILSRHMPMWPVVPGYGNFVNDNSLTLREIDYTVAWVDGMGPRTSGSVFLNVAGAGDESAKIVKAHFDFGRWFLGKPDLLLQVPQNTIAPGSADQVKETVIDSGLTTDRWLRGIEYKPGNRRVVHAAFFKIQETGEWIGSWTPWYGFSTLPKGLAYRLPARSHIVAEIYYDGVKAPAEDQGSLGLYFADEPSSRPVSDMAIVPRCAAAGEGGESVRCSGAEKSEPAIHALAFWPKLYPGLRSIELDARSPDGAIQVLLLERDPPVDWPTPYILKTPLDFSAGTEFSVIEYYGKGQAPSGEFPLMVSAYRGTVLPGTEPTVVQTAPAEVPAKRFELQGTVKSVDPSDRSLVVQHGDIPGFMGAMTMTYSAGPAVDLTKISKGDQIQADIVVRGGDTHLENIHVIGHSN